MKTYEGVEVHLHTRWWVVSFTLRSL